MENPKNILITGASSGIGRALAYEYAAPGVKLFLGGRNPGRLEETADACRSMGAEVFCKILDVTDRAAMEAWVLEADGVAPLDLVIANAGISGGTLIGGTENAAQEYRIFDTNIYGMLHTFMPAVNVMAGRRRGQIAVLSSLAGYRGMPSAPAYSASKAAVRAWGEAMRPLLAEAGVEVNVICPGFVRSGITDCNDFKMPFLMRADKAARIIRRGLRKNKARVVFPFIMGFAAWLASVWTPAIGDCLYRMLPKKKFRTGACR